MDASSTPQADAIFGEDLPSEAWSMADTAAARYTRMNDLLEEADRIRLSLGLTAVTWPPVAPSAAAAVVALVGRSPTPVLIEEARPPLSVEAAATAPSVESIQTGVEPATSSTREMAKDNMCSK